MIWKENDAASQICNYWNKQCKTRCLWGGAWPDKWHLRFYIREHGSSDNLSVTEIRWSAGMAIEDAFEKLLVSHAEQMLSGVVNPGTF